MGVIEWAALALVGCLYLCWCTWMLIRDAIASERRRRDAQIVRYHCVMLVDEPTLRQLQVFQCTVDGPRSVTVGWRRRVEASFARRLQTEKPPVMLSWIPE